MVEEWQAGTLQRQRGTFKPNYPRVNPAGRERDQIDEERETHGEARTSDAELSGNSAKYYESCSITDPAMRGKIN